MFSAIRRVVPVFVLLVTLLASSVALAQPAPWERVDVTLHSEQDSDIMLVAGIMPQATKLPIDAEISVPSGSRVKWIGQILGGDPASDPELEHSKSTAGAADIYKFTLTKSPAMQIEVTSAEKTLFDGKTYRPTLRWISTQAVPEVRLSVRVPKGAKVVQPAKDAAMAEGPEGFAYYTKTVRDVKPGDRLELAFAYESDGVTAAPQSATGASAGGETAATSPSPLPVLVLVVFVIGGAVGLLVLKRGRSKKAATSDESGAGSSASLKRNVATMVVAVALVAAVVVVGQQATKPQVVGDTITRVFSQEDPCTSAKIALSVPGNADHAKVAEQLFDALGATKGGVARATYNRKTATLEVGFCESKSSESAVRSALAPTGLVAASAATSAAPVP